MIKIRGIELKNQLDEITIKEYEHIISILNDKKKATIDKYLDIIVVCGLKDDNILYEITFDELKEFIHSLNIEINQWELTQSIEINNRTYVSYKPDTIFKISAYDTGKIESVIKKNGMKYILESIAILFKDDQLTYKEHYDSEHIKHKMILFSSTPAIVFIPFIQEIVESVINKSQNIDNKNRVDNILTEIDEFRRKAEDTTELE